MITILHLQVHFLFLFLFFFTYFCLWAFVFILLTTIWTVMAFAYMNSHGLCISGEELNNMAWKKKLRKRGHNFGSITSVSNRAYMMLSMVWSSSLLFPSRLVYASFFSFHLFFFKKKLNRNRGLGSLHLYFESLHDPTKCLITKNHIDLVDVIFLKSLPYQAFYEFCFRECALHLSWKFLEIVR